MATSWYYVEGNDRVGPIDEYALEKLISTGALNESSYIWKKGYESWLKLGDINELQKYTKLSEESEMPEMAPPLMDEPPVESVKREIHWDNLSSEDKIFTVKIGFDRGLQEGAEYGPYSIDTLKKLYVEKRINGKTLIYVPGMDNWAYLADLPVYEKTFQESPPVIGEEERRNNIRKPFITRLFFHDSEDVYEGVCRDISIGGMQVLVADYPAQLGAKVSLNVHPDNSEYCFVAGGKIVRMLDGQLGFSLRFLDLSKEAVAAIESYLSDL